MDWVWIWRGFRIATPFFVSTAFLNILSYMPRYILFYLRGLEQTGIFGFYAGIAFGIANLPATITIPEGVAKAIYSYSQHGEAAFARDMHRLWRDATLLSLFLAACLLLVFPFILPLVGSQNYPMDWTLLVLVILANVAQVSSLVAQTSLYARHRDKEILFSTLGAGTLSAGLQYALTLAWGMHGLAIAMALSMVILTLLFMFFDRKSKKLSGGAPTTR
jgi:O-antigen/teichoic acid export membrane protein